MKKLCLLPAVAFGVVCAVASAQQPAPAPYFAVNCVKVKPGKSAEFDKWTKDVLHKYAQARVDSGAVTAWVLLGSVQPSGTTKECDYIISAFFPGIPPKPMEKEAVDALLKKSGAGVSVDQYREKRDELSELATSGIWQQVAHAGSPGQKGDYLAINYNKTKDGQKWIATEKRIWMPFADELAKQGIIRGWEVDARVVPDGSDLKYDGVTVDAYPSWDAYFNFMTNPKLEELWKKVHPDLTFQTAFEDEYPKVTNQLRVELWVIEDLVAAQK
jgi:hypothetical protein